jgi:hypothetical protein
MRDVLRWAYEARARLANGALPSPGLLDKGKGKAALNSALESEARRRRDLALESARYLDLDPAELGIDFSSADVIDDVCVLLVFFSMLLLTL